MRRSWIDFARMGTCGSCDAYQYGRHLSVLAGWQRRQSAGRDLAVITHDGVAAFFTSDEALLRPDGQPKKASSMNALRTSVRVFFDYLQRVGELDLNPARVVRMARAPAPMPRPLLLQETARLLAALRADGRFAAVRDRALFEFILGTGARLGSALALRVESVDQTAGEAELVEVKGGGAMRVFFAQDVAEALRRVIGSRRSGHVFLGHGDSPLTARHARRRFAEWLDSAGIPQRYSPHSLRHTFATRLYQRTGDIALVKAALGHRSITSTMVYARADEDRVRAAVLG